MTTGEMTDGEEGEGETSEMNEEATGIGVLEVPSGTSKVVNNSKMVLVRVLIRRRNRLLCRLVVRRSRVGGKVMPTIGKSVAEVVSRQNREGWKENREVLASLIL